jgi:hypothetical protein
MHRPSTLDVFREDHPRQLLHNELYKRREKAGYVRVNLTSRAVKFKYVIIETGKEFGDIPRLFRAMSKMCIYAGFNKA